MNSRYFQGKEIIITIDSQTPLKIKSSQNSLRLSKALKKFINPMNIFNNANTNFTK